MYAMVTSGDGRNKRFDVRQTEGVEVGSDLKKVRFKDLTPSGYRAAMAAFSFW